MADGYLQVEGGQQGDKVRTAKKTLGVSEVHEEYVIHDIPFTLVGSYHWGAPFTGLTGSVSTGILAALHCPVAASGPLILRRMGLGFNNEGAAANNLVSMTRMAGFPGSNTPSADVVGKKDTTHPANNARVYVKPTGMTIGLGELALKRQLWPKTSAANVFGAMYEDFSNDAEHFFIRPGEALVLYQESAGTTTETWQISFEWLEVLL